jgi:hypothetical protein
VGWGRKVVGSGYELIGAFNSLKGVDAVLGSIWKTPEASERLLKPLKDF